MTIVIMCGILVVLILLLCFISAAIGFYVGCNKIFTKGYKNEIQPLPADEKAKIDRADKRRKIQEENFWNYDGFKQE